MKYDEAIYSNKHAMGQEKPVVSIYGKEPILKDMFHLFLTCGLYNLPKKQFLSIYIWGNQGRENHKFYTEQNI